MIKEAYCSFEVAKLLKEKGFDEPCSHFYKFGSNELYCGTVMTNSSFKDAEIYNSCTHQMAMAWLREKHNIHIVGNIFQDFSNDADGNVVDEFLYWSWNIYSLLDGSNIAEPHLGEDAYDSYQEAIEAALKYSLENLI